MQDKRGLSAIVATLIIILLVLVAVGIVWVVIRNIITEGAEGIELGRFTFDLSIKSAYIDGTNVKVTVRRSPGGGNLIGVKFIFLNSTDSIIVNRNIPLTELQERLFSFDSNDVGDISALQEVSVAPIYESSSGTETVGEITDTATISGSGNGGNGNGGNGGNGNGGNGGNGGAVCGDGSLDLGEECDDGNTDDGDGCSSTCQDEGAGQSFCGDGTCDIIEDSSNCPVDCGIPASCDGIWDGNDAGINECDGTPLPTNCLSDCTCSVGFTLDGVGGCNLNSPINTGTIFSVWPSGAVKYFDSEDLPTDVSGYTMYYVNFSNSEENGCFRITWAEYMDTNGRSYIRTEFMVNISGGDDDGYLIWEAENCGA